MRNFSLPLLAALALCSGLAKADVSIAAPACGAVITLGCDDFRAAQRPNIFDFQLLFPGYASYYDSNQLYTRLVSSPGASGWNELLEFEVGSNGTTVIGGIVCTGGTDDGCSDTGGYYFDSPLPQDGTVDNGTSQLVSSFPLYNDQFPKGIVNFYFSSATDVLSFDVIPSGSTTTPEPAYFASLAAGLLGLGVAHHRRQRLRARL